MSAWEPLLQGTVAEEAKASVLEIAADLQRELDIPPGRLEGNFKHSVAFGSAGVSLFFSYLHRALGQGYLADLARSYLLDSAAGLEDPRMVPDLFQGFSGIAWAFEHTKDLIEIPLADDAFDEIEAGLESWANSGRVSAELMQGLGGICVYAAERLPSQQSRALLEKVVRQLQKDANSVLHGKAWRVSSGFSDVYPEHKAKFDAGVYRISVAHGVAGVIGGLTAAYKGGIERATVRKLVGEAVDWIFANEIREPSRQVFPEMVGIDLPQLTTGWCSGDLGISCVLFNIARVFQRFDWIENCLRIARREAKLVPEQLEEANRSNYTFCHGAVGRAHMFNRLFQATSDEVFASASRYWYQYTLGLKRKGRGIGGFFVNDEAGLSYTRSFLMGASGLGLCLLAGFTDLEPAWDRLVLLSTREVPDQPTMSLPNE
jgi:lantibiotic modifying enzyme